jgi:hypothetical protein
MHAAEGVKEAALRSCEVILTINPQDKGAVTLKSTLDRYPWGPPVEPETYRRTAARLEKAHPPDRGEEARSHVAGLAADSATSDRPQTLRKRARLEQLLRTIRLRHRG